MGQPLTVSRTPVVLVVSGQDDHTPDIVIPELADLGAEVVRLDPTATPLRIDCCLKGGRWHGAISAGSGREVQVERVTAVMFRWPPAPPGHPAIQDKQEQRWSAIENTQALSGILKSLDVRWMNYPDHVVASASKPMQLRDAFACGLRVPETLLATAGHSARRWAADAAVLAKTFRAEHEGTLTPARRIDPDELPDELLSPVIFQQVIEGTPLRVIVVGDKIFAAAIDGHADLDWRPSQADLTMTPVEPPPTVRDAIAGLMRRWGLVYGAWDFIDDGHDWQMLECNPAGHYGFVESKTGLPITAAIAAWLTGSP